MEYDPRNIKLAQERGSTVDTVRDTQRADDRTRRSEGYYRRKFERVGSKSGNVDFKVSKMAAYQSGAGSGTTPWQMSFTLNGSNDPIVTFNSENTDVLIRGTNNLFYTLGDGTGSPQNIDDEIALTTSATNYVYAEASWADSDSTTIAEFTFNIVVYTSEQDITEISTDAVPDPDVEFQSKSRTLIGTIELDGSDELSGSGLTQFTNTRLFAELFGVSSATVYLFVP